MCVCRGLAEYSSASKSSGTVSVRLRAMNLAVVNASVIKTALITTDKCRYIIIACRAASSAASLLEAADAAVAGIVVGTDGKSKVEPEAITAGAGADTATAGT